MPPPNPPNCPEIYPWFSTDPAPPTAWVGMPPAAQGGQADYRGACAVSCRPCIQDDPQTFEPNVGVSTSGHRWLRPNNLMESRDAYGRYPFIGSAEPVRLPYPWSWHQISMVWCMSWTAAMWQEFWLEHICEADLKTCLTAPECPAPPYFLKHATWWWMRGGQYRFPPNELICTGNYLGAEAQPVRFDVGSLGNAGFVSTGKSNAGTGGACSPSFAALCSGKGLEPHGECDSHYQGSQFPADYFVENRSIWDRFYILNMAASLVADSNSPDQDPAAIAANKTALAWLCGHYADIGMDQVDHTAGDNANLDWSARGWNDSGSLYPTIEDVPHVLASWPGCRLRYSGHAVIAELVPWNIAIRMSFVPLRVDDRAVCEGWIGDPLLRSEKMNATYPLIKLQIEMLLGVRARFVEEGPHQHVRNWLPADDPTRVVDLAITNRTNERFPVVTAPDEIVYVDEIGREFDGRPPLTVRWLGCVEPLTRHEWADVFAHAYYAGLGETTARKLCCGLAKGMGNVTVHAEASHVDETTEAAADRLYTGSVRIGVNHQVGGYCPP